MFRFLQTLFPAPHKIPTNTRAHPQTYSNGPIVVVPKECLQLDTKLVCVQCKTLQCECPPSVERRSIRSLPEGSSLVSAAGISGASPQLPNSAATAVDSGSSTSRTRTRLATPDTIGDDRPAAIRLASILGIRRGAATADCTDASSSSGGSRSTINGTPRKTSNTAGGASESQDNAMTSSPAANWFKDKYQMATNKLMSKV